MTNDPIIDEVHQAREQYSERFGHDLTAICRDLQQKQSCSTRPVVTFPPKRPSPSASAGHQHSVVSTAQHTTVSVTDQELVR